MKPELKQLLLEKAPLTFDGAMSTSLYEKGFYINRSFEELCVTEAAAVQEVTACFKRAGSTLLRTNTFNAQHPKLTQYGLQDRLEEILQAACKITKEVADLDAYTLASMGPLGIVLEPLGPTSFEEAVEYYKRNTKVFEDCGVDGFSLDCFHDLNEMHAAIVAIRTYSDKPIFAHMGIQESLKSSFGFRINDFVEFCEAYEIEAMGFSGEVGPSGMLSALEKLRPLTQKPISILPNAGLPKYVNDQYIYMCSPDYMGKFAKRFAQAGANIVGGQSGVYETHIKAVSNALRMTQSLVEQAKSPHQPTHVTVTSEKAREKVQLKERSLLGKYLEADKKVLTVEVVPPKGIDSEKFFSHCKTLQDSGVEFINIPDGARAVARMSSLQMSSYVKSKFNLEPIPHFTSRDRNLIGIQSDLLGAHINGVRNVLLVTGDPPKLGNCPGATAVYDVDAIGMTHITSQMNKGLDLGGTPFGQPTSFTVGVALNPTARNQELELKRFGYKIEAGADYAITQPIYDVDVYKKFMDSHKGESIPVIMGVWPLVSLRNAEFLKNEVPGVVVPDWVISEMEKAGDDKEEATKRGIEIAIKTMEKAKADVQGFQVAAPFNRVSIAIESIKSAGFL